MDIVVVLAFLVLSAVFLISLLVLIVMCYRRRLASQVKATPPRIARIAENAENIENLGQLSPLIGELLDKNIWVYDAGGIMQHCVALLRLSRTLTEKLATVSLAGAPQPIAEAICKATRNIYPRFDDLLEVIADSTVDFRVLEARAMSLGTVCWALHLPFVLLSETHKDIINEPLKEMNHHLITIRAATEVAEASHRGRDENTALMNVKSHLQQIKHNVRSSTIHEEEEPADDDNDKPSTSGIEMTERTPLVSSEEVPSNSEEGKSENVEEEEKEVIVQSTPLITYDGGNSTAKIQNGGHTVIEGFPPDERDKENSPSKPSSPNHTTTTESQT